MENLHKVEQGTNLKIFTQENDLDICIEQFLIAKKAENLSIGTLVYYRNKLRYFQDFCDSQLISKVTEITSNNIRAFMLSLEGANHNPGGQHSVYRAIKTFLRWWEDEIEPEGWHNPIKKVNPPKVPKLVLSPITIEDINSLLSTCHNAKFTDVRDKAILYTLWDSGARASELLSINKEDIDTFSGQILIREGKGRKSRYVYVGHKTRKAIRRYLQFRKDNNPALFVTDDGTRLDYFGLRSMIVRRSQKANIKPPSLHSFRRLFAISCLRSGMNIYVLQSIMGHADLSVMQRYLKINNSDVEEAYKQNSPVDRLRQ